jgi:putative membrane protein
MKKHLWILFAGTLGFTACNNEAKDSVEQADSANEAKLDSPTTRQSIVADEESANFLVKAANAGMAEVECGQLAQQKAKDQRVKDFGAMMTQDHSAANDQVKALASQRNITLPDSVSDDKRKDKDDLAKKSGADFDKAYMKAMVDDHNDAIDLFEKASSNVKDAEVKSFVDNTLPKLRHHLDSAKAVQKGLK